MKATKFKVGDKIVFGRSKRNKQLVDITIGKIYTIVTDGRDDIVIIDDAGDHNSVVTFGIGKATKIT